MGRFRVLFLSHTAPGFQLWFYFLLYMWVVHWGLASEASLEGLGLPLWGPGVEVMQLLGSQGFWQHQVRRGIDGQGSRKYSALEGYGNQNWPICFSILVWWTPSLTDKPDRPQSTGSQRVRQDRSNPACINTRIFFFFFSLWQLCPSESWAWRWCNCLACRDAGSTKCSETRTTSMAGVMALSESFSEPVVGDNQKASLASLSL